MRCHCFPTIIKTTASSHYTLQHRTRQESVIFYGLFALLSYLSVVFEGSLQNSQHTLFFYPTLCNGSDNRHFDYSIQFILEDAVQMLLIVTRTMASVGSTSVGFGFSTKADFPFYMYVYANIISNN